MTENALFKNLKFGVNTLKNRIAMAPLTRGRAGESRVPNELMGEYYHQRSEAGLLISEGTFISEQGIGWVGAPGIYTDEMQLGWKNINDRLKESETLLFLQLWHTGRASHSDFHKGELPVSASAIKLNGDFIYTSEGQKEYEVPRALESSEIKDVIQDYKKAALRAIKAGLGGVEIHAANGYLINQFLDSKSNVRTDEYGGSIENRFRFLKEIIESILEVVPSSQVGVRLSPNGAFNDMGSSDFRELYDYVIKELDGYNLAYLHVMDGVGFGFHGFGEPYTLDDVKKIYHGIVIGNCGHTIESAREAVENGKADLIAFGRAFITNPDLPSRIKNNLELTPYDDMSKWYGGGSEGYTDYLNAK